MSLNHITNQTLGSRQTIYVQSCNASELKVAEKLDVRDLTFDAVNGDKIELSSLPNKGTFGSVLKSNGDGTVQWGTDLTGGVNYTGSLPTAINQLSLYNSTDGTAIKNSSLIEQDLLDTQQLALDNQSDISTLQNDKLNKLNDTATNLSVETNLNITGQLNYRKANTAPLYDTGLWSDYTLEKGLVSGGVPTLTYPTPTTSDEARTITISAGSGFIQVAGGNKAYLEFLETTLIIPPNSNGRIRVSNTGVVSFLNNPNITNSQTNFVICRVVTNTDSILFIDTITTLGIPNKENLQSEANLTFGTYFNENTSLKIEETPTPLYLNDLGFTYYYKNQEFVSGGKSQLEFFKFHRDATETLGYKQLSATQTIDDLYDNGTNNVVSMPSGKYKKDLFFYLDYRYLPLPLFQRKYFIIYSTQLYDTLKDAQIGPNPPIPSFIPTGAVQLCCFIVKKDGASTILEEIQDSRKFITSQIPYASRDDHSQYLLIDGTRSMIGNLNMNNNDIINCNELKTDFIASSTTTDVKMNSNLNLNGKNIIGLDLINGIQPSGGLYSESSGYTIPATNTVETNLLGQGDSSGSLSIPANTFTNRAFYSFKASGILTGGANDTFTLKALSLTGIPTVVELGTIVVQLTDNGLVDTAWNIVIDFTIRQIGGLGVGFLVLSGYFQYTNNNDVVKTYLRLFKNNTTFSTETSNQLVLEYKNDVTNPVTSFSIEQASFTRWF